MPQRVRADAGARARRGDVASYEPVDAPYGQPRAAVVHEQWLSRVASSSARCGTPPNEQFAGVQVRANRLRRADVERDHPRLAAFAPDPHHPRAQIHIIEIEADELAETQSRRVEQ